MADIFIAHARRDLTFVERLADRLGGEGYSVTWRDRAWPLPSDDDAREQERREIETASAVLLVWSGVEGDDMARDDMASLVKRLASRRPETTIVLTLDGASPPAPFAFRQALPFGAGAADHNTASFVRLIEHLDFRLAVSRDGFADRERAVAAPSPPAAPPVSAELTDPPAPSPPPPPQDDVPAPAKAPAREENRSYETVVDVPNDATGVFRPNAPQARDISDVPRPSRLYDPGPARARRAPSRSAARAGKRSSALELGVFIGALAGLTLVSWAASRGFLDGLLGGVLLTGGGRGDRAPAAPTDRVHASLFAPRRLTQGEWAQAQLFLHLYQDRGAARTEAQEIDPGATKRAGAALRARLARGTRVTAQILPLDGPAEAFEIDAADPSAIWDGAPTSIDFFIRAAADTPAGRYRFAVLLYAGARAMGELTFVTDLGAATGVSAAEAQPDAAHQAAEAARSYRRVFFSYAREDAERVRLVARGYDMIDQSFFWDVEDLKPGDDWEAELYRRIDQSDLFILFWSEAARRSDMVRKEVERALSGEAADGRPRFAPFPLDGPPPPKLWDTIRARHVGDHLYYRVVSHAEQAARRGGDGKTSAGPRS